MSSILSITYDTDEPSLLSPEKMGERASLIRDNIDLHYLEKVKEKLAEYVSGNLDMTGLNFYYMLEKCTPIILFHTIIRKGERNRNFNGLQQTYGEHTRLLVFGIDKLESQDIDWYKSRFSNKSEVDINQIESFVADFKSLNTSRELLASIWLAAVLHDYGKLFWRGYGLDAEEAVPLCEPIFSYLTQKEHHSLIKFAIRNHDLVEYVFNGETPVNFIQSQVSQLPTNFQKLALSLLGIIQLAGAASLGEGRLTKRKIQIFNQCNTGNVISFASFESRLYRLLFGEQIDLSDTPLLLINNELNNLTEKEKNKLINFLNRVILHNWAEYKETLILQMSETTPKKLVETLLDLAVLWSDHQDCEHVVLPKEASPDDDFSKINTRIIALLNNSKALLVGDINE